MSNLAPETEVKISLPHWSEDLFKPYRYKVAYGGRGSSKSWSFAAALLLEGTSRPLRILCAREIQKSLKESVHQLLCDTINRMNLSSFYQVLDTEIRGRNGTTFSFSGLQQHTVDSIKSFEGADIVWIEEAHSVSKKSWDTLIPTIRKPGSEIWVTFNPSLDSDEAWVRFVINTPPNSWVCEVNYTDNPWFPAELEAERLHCMATNPEDYKNIWEGKCRSAVEGAIYADEVAELSIEGRVTLLPYDPKCMAHSIWDLGWNDSMAIAIVQRVGPTGLAVIDYIEDSHKTLDYYADLLNNKPYRWGSHWIPHDGTHKDFKTGQSTQDILKKLLKGKMKPNIIPNIGIESGIKMARMLLRRAYFDKIRTSRLLECLKRYRRAVNKQTGEPGAPVHDEFSHGADVWRYVGVVADQLKNDTESPFGNAPVVSFGTYDPVTGY